MREILKGQPATAMLFVASSTDHLTPKTGASLSVALSKNGGAFGSSSATVTERGYGWYAVALPAEDTDTEGDLVLRATASGADAAERCLAVYTLKAADALRVGGAAQSSGDLAALSGALRNAVDLYGAYGGLNRHLSALGFDPAEGFWLNLDTPLTPQQSVAAWAAPVDDPGAGATPMPLGILTGNSFENAFALDTAFTSPVAFNSRVEFTLENTGETPFGGALLQLVAASSTFGVSPKNWTFALPPSPAGRSLKFRALSDGTLVCAEGAPDMVFTGRHSLILGG